jgi:O-antigen ligase
MLFEAICWIGVSLSLLGFVQLASGTKALLWLKPLNTYFFSTFGYTNLAGAYFTMMAALSFGLWMQHLGEKKQMILFPTIEHAEEMSVLSANRMLLAFIVNVAGAVASVSRAAILFCSALMMVLVLYGFCFVWRRVTKPMKWLFSASVLGVFVTAIALIISFPVKNIQHEAEGISTSAVLERVTGVGGQNSRVAMEILVKYPIFGVGGRHYALYRPLFWKGDYAKTLDCPCANAHNDIYQFMAEYGIVGFGLMVALLAVLVGSIIYAVLRMMFAQRLAISMAIRDKGSAPFYRIPPPAMVVLVATVILIAHAYGDVVMRTPAILLIWLLALTSVSGWFPVFKKAK